MRASELRALADAVQDRRRSLPLDRCSHEDPDECCDQCRIEVAITRPVLLSMQACLRLSEAILASPEVWEALEAVETLGDERANCRKWQDVLTRPPQRIEDERRHEEAREAIASLADLLHESRGTP